jgi:hypothetical protein
MQSEHAVESSIFSEVLPAKNVSSPMPLLIKLFALAFANVHSNEAFRSFLDCLRHSFPNPAALHYLELMVPKTGHVQQAPTFFLHLGLPLSDVLLLSSEKTSLAITY